MNGTCALFSCMEIIRDTIQALNVLLTIDLLKSEWSEACVSPK